jgi:hypothetical protein
MIVIFWSPRGVPVIQDRPPKVTFTPEFFVDAILPHVVSAKPTGGPGRRLVLHMDNASPHRVRLTAQNLEENRIAASPHPVFSSDLALSDFVLFGALKRQLSGHIFESPDELVEGIYEIVRAIPRTRLERVSLE